MATHLNDKELFLDLRELTYSDVGSEQVLRVILAQVNAEIGSSTPSIPYLVGEFSEAN